MSNSHHIPFFKYHGAGNDFILIDNRTLDLSLTTRQVAQLCDRHFGIGADGLMLLDTSRDYDFKMVYYNSDGKESTMCGNGGRCITAFARDLEIIEHKAYFLAIDGAHEAFFTPSGLIRLQMQDVQDILFRTDHYLINTGSSHYVMFREKVAAIDVLKEGRAIRHQQEFEPQGINVNFAEQTKDHLFVRTYERGVENETLSCGTGVTACAIAASGQQTGSFETTIRTPGGTLEVSFTKPAPDSAQNIWLTGPAERVFQGHIHL